MERKRRRSMEQVNYYPKEVLIYISWNQWRQPSSRCVGMFLAPRVLVEHNADKGIAGAGAATSQPQQWRLLVEVAVLLLLLGFCDPPRILLSPCH
jgi:hypothetical protein